MISKLKPKSEFSRNILTLMTGTTIAQAIPIAISPILTRIYTPEDFGLLGLFLAISGLFATIINGKYELALMLPKKDEDAINILALGFVISTLISLMILFFVIIFNDYIINILENDKLRIWLYFIPLCTFFIGAFNLLNYYNSRKKLYSDIKNALILKSIIMAISQILIGLVKNGVSGLILGEIFSRSFSNFKLLKNILKDKALIEKIKLTKMIALGKKYKEFPLVNAPSSLADILTLQLPFILIPKMYNLTIAGYFVLVQKMVSIPSALIAKSISQVYFQSLSELANLKVSTFSLLKRTIVKLIIISLPIAICIFFISPYIFEIVFGKEWKEAGEIAKYFSIIFFVRFIASTVSISFSVTRELNILARWQYIYLLSSVLLFLYFLYFQQDVYTFLIFFVFHEVLLYLVYLYLVIKSVKKMDKLNINMKGNKCVE